MPNHSRATRISKELRWFLKNQEERSSRWKEFNASSSPDYIGRRGILFCDFSYHSPKQYPKGKKLNLGENLGFWKNFDLQICPLIKKELKERECASIASYKELNNLPFAPQHLIPENKKESLGEYIQQLVKFLNSEKLTRTHKNTAQDLLAILQEKLFRNTKFTATEKLLVLEIYQLSYEKKLNPYSYKPRKNARKSTCRIEEDRAAAIINYLIEKFLKNHCLEIVLTLLYIWVALHTSFSSINTTVKQILELYIPSPINSKSADQLKKKIPIMKGKKIYFNNKELSLSDTLYKILDTIVDGRSEKPIFKNAQYKIEKYLQEADCAVIHALKLDKPNPISLETFLHRPAP